MKRAVAFAAAAVLAAAPGIAFAGLVANSVNFLLSVPTLDEVGLGGLIAVTAGVAGWSLRRRKRK